MLIFLIVGIVRQAVSLDFFFAHPLDGEAQQESVAFDPDSIGFKEVPNGSKDRGSFDIEEGNTGRISQIVLPQKT